MRRDLATSRPTRPSRPSRRAPRASWFCAAFMVALAGSLSGCGDDETSTEECTVDEDCEDGERCTADGRCVADAECVNDADCEADDLRNQCNLETLECEPRPPFGDDCDAERPCPFGTFCSELLGRCLDTSSARDCSRRAQCPAGQICDRSANKCIENPGCYGDEFCEEGEVCDLVSRDCTSVSVECVPCGSGQVCPNGTSCTNDSAECLATGQESFCRTGEFCDVLGRCVQCSNNDDCGPGLFCNASLGRCESNVQCVEELNECPNTQNVQCIVCESPEVCDPRTRRCQAPPTECEADLDCAESDFCDLSLPVPICIPRVPDCLNDLLGEPNNEIGLAALLEEDEGPAYDDLKICPGDEDWYRIDVAAGTYLTVDARFRHDEGDLEMQMLLPDGVSLLDESRSVTDNERVELAAGTDITVYVRVFLAVPSTVPPEYRLIVARDAEALCPDDGNEDDDVLGAAGDIISDEAYDGRLCPADPDWFALRSVPVGSRITADLEFRDVLGDLDLELYRAGSSTPLARVASVTDDERIVYDASFGGDYFFRVLGKRADSNVYTLRASVRDVPGAVCADDAFEPNNNTLEATSAPTDTGSIAPGLSICAADEDWYAVDLEFGDIMRAEIGFEPEVDLELELYAPGAISGQSTPIRRSIGTSPREFISWSASAEGAHFLRVFGANGEQISPYELRVSSQEYGECVPDTIDQAGRGNTFATSFDLGPAPTRRDDLTLCNLDEDYYAIQLPAGYRHILRIHYVDSSATLDMELLDGAGSSLAETSGAGFDSKEIAVNVPGQGGFFPATIKVFRSSGFATPYSITADLAPLFTCGADQFEPNDSPETATETASSAAGAPYNFDSLALCTSIFGPSGLRGDEDWFVLNPPVSGTQMTAELEHLQGDLFLELFSPGGQVRACLNDGQSRCFSDGIDTNEMVTFTATVAAPYFLRVSSIYSDPIIANPPPDADTPYSLQIDYVLP